MQELMKTRPTNRIQVIIQDKIAKYFMVPKVKAMGLVQLLGDYEEPRSESISAEKVFQDLDKKYGRFGSVLQGARLKEEMSQAALAKKIGIAQADLSKMEHGKRPIGPKMARRFGRVLKIDYRIFL